MPCICKELNLQAPPFIMMLNSFFKKCIYEGSSVCSNYTASLTRARADSVRLLLLPMSSAELGKRNAIICKGQLI